MISIRFDPTDCALFEPRKQASKRFNDKRRIVMTKFLALADTLRPEMQKHGFRLVHKVSRYSPNAMKPKVAGIWLPFTKKEHCRRWAQLNIGIYEDGLSIGVQVPRSSQDIPRLKRTLMTETTFVLQSVRSLKPGHGYVGVYPRGRRKKERNAAVTETELIELAEAVDRHTSVSIAEHYPPQEMPSGTRLVSRIITVFDTLRGVFEMITGGVLREQPKIEFQRCSSEQIARAKRVLQGEHVESDQPSVWRTARNITKAIRTSAKIVVSGEPRIVAGLNLHPLKVGGESILVTPGFPVPPAHDVRELREEVAAMVRMMGGNPKAVKVMVTHSYTDARLIEDQLFVNALLTDRRPIFWGIVAARELAHLVSRSHYPHVRWMSLLLERLLENGLFARTIASQA